MTILEAKEIFKSFHKPKRVEVLSDLSLSLKKGKSIAITGKSGEGKTTLIHILGTLEKPDSGTIEFLRKPIEDIATFRNKKVGFIFQSYNLLEDLSVLDNVLMPARIGKVKIDKVNAFKLLREVDMEERINFPIRLLSGGEKQRVAIARAFCNDPEIILADEPSGNLDSITSRSVYELLLKFVKEREKSLIVVTHDKELSSLCDETFTLKSGHLI